MSFIYRVFLKGLLALLPLLITVYLLVWVASGAEAIFGEPLRSATSLYFPGAGIFIAAILIFLVGLLVNNYLAKRFFAWFEERLDHTPIIRSIYSPIRDVTNIFAGTSSQASQRVVLVHIDSLGIDAMGLITREHFDDLPKGTIPPGNVAVFLPFSYGVGGFTVVVPRSKVRETSIPADKAMQLAITGWVKASHD